MGGTKEGPMFTSLRAGTKPYILCATSIISIAVTVCGLVTEEQIGLELPRRKLAGARYLAALREIYAVIFARRTDAPELRRGVDESPKVVVNAEADAASSLPTVEREQILESSLRRCRSNQAVAANVMAADTDDDVERTGTAQSLQAKLEIREPHDVSIRTHDSGSRIGQENVERIFGPFLTTRSNSVSKSCLACRLVIEVRDGRPSPFSGVLGGSVFQVALPVGNFGSAQ
jgi:hypothetical protein